MPVVAEPLGSTTPARDRTAVRVVGGVEWMIEAAVPGHKPSFTDVRSRMANIAIVRPKPSFERLQLAGAMRSRYTLCP